MISFNSKLGKLEKTFLNWKFIFCFKHKVCVCVCVLVGGSNKTKYLRLQFCDSSQMQCSNNTFKVASRTALSPHEVRQTI